jgi:hypothetical protein
VALPGSAQGIAVSATQANTSSQAVAETTSGSSQQSTGQTRNPFTPLPEPKPAKTASTTPSTTSGSSSSSGSASASTPAESGSPASGGSGGSGGSGSSGGSPASGSGEAAPQPVKKPSTPKKESVYHVTAAFGIAPAGAAPLSTQLTPYPDLKRQQPLPSTAQPLVVFRGVTVGGKSATFTLVGEAILRGSAKCLPSASQCQAIELKPGQSEELEYIPLGGTAVTYQLHVVSIETVKATAATARRAFGGESKPGLQVLRRAGLQALPGMRYSRSKGVLVLLAPRASVARVHVSAWGVPPGL